MAVTPQQFGMQVGQQTKQAFLGRAVNAAGKGIANFAAKNLGNNMVGNAVSGLGNSMRGVGAGIRSGERALGAAVNEVGSELGNAANQVANTATTQMRGLGIQAQRATNRLQNAAQPLVKEVNQMGSDIAGRMGKTMFGTPTRAAVTGGVAGAGLMAGQQMKQSALVGGMLGDAMLKAKGQKTMNPLERAVINPMLAAQGHGSNLIGSDGVFRNPQTPATPAPEEAAAAAGDKMAALMLPSAGIGAGLGAATAPSGHRMEGVGRGAVKGTATGAGMMVGAPIGALGTLLLASTNPRLAKKFFAPSARQLGDYLKSLARRGQLVRRAGGPGSSPASHLQAMNTLFTGGVGGAALGGGAGYSMADAAMGAPSWEGKKASLLGGVLGSGVGGLAGGVGGGLMGALTGGALGGAPGAGLGLLSGGALGLGAGAHLGGNIGSSIGKKKKPDDEKSEKKDDEKDDKKEEEEIKESAARVLAQLQKNA